MITGIAKDHGKSPTQVVLRWHIQLGLVAIPRSGNPGRIAENIDIFDFELTEEEMSTISGLDRGESVVSDSDVGSVISGLQHPGTWSVRRRLIQSRRRTSCANARNHDAGHGEPLHPAQKLPQHDHRGERGRGRLQTHQDAEDSRRNAT